MSDMKDALLKMENKRAENASIAWAKTLADGLGLCSGLSYKEFASVKVKQRQSYMKGKNFSHRQLWNHNNINTK